MIFIAQTKKQNLDILNQQFRINSGHQSLLIMTEADVKRFAEHIGREDILSSPEIFNELFPEQAVGKVHIDTSEDMDTALNLAKLEFIKDNKELFQFNKKDLAKAHDELMVKSNIESDLKEPELDNKRVRFSGSRPKPSGPRL